MRPTAAIARRPRKGERLETRLTPEQERLITRAAALRGFSVTEFVMASTQQAALDAIKEFDLLTLHDDAREVSVNAILHPPSPSRDSIECLTCHPKSSNCSRVEHPILACAAVPDKMRNRFVNEEEATRGSCERGAYELDDRKRLFWVVFPANAGATRMPTTGAGRSQN